MTARPADRRGAPDARRHPGAPRQHRPRALLAPPGALGSPARADRPAADGRCRRCPRGRSSSAGVFSTGSRSTSSCQTRLAPTLPMNRECAGLVMSAPPNGALQLTWPGHLVYIHPAAVEPSEAVTRLPPAQARPFTVHFPVAAFLSAAKSSARSRLPGRRPDAPGGRTDAGAPTLVPMRPDRVLLVGFCFVSGGPAL